MFLPGLQRKSLIGLGGRRGWLFSRLVSLDHQECLHPARRALACQKILLRPQENLNDLQWEKPPVLQGSVAPLTSPPPGSEFSANFLKRNCVLLNTSLKVLIGFWVIDGISSPQGKNANLSIIFHLPKTTNWEQEGLMSMSAQLMRRVTLTNPSGALMGSTPAPMLVGGRLRSTSTDLPSLFVSKANENTGRVAPVMTPFFRR